MNFIKLNQPTKLLLVYNTLNTEKEKKSFIQLICWVIDTPFKELKQFFEEGVK